jgi:transcriptional regulator with GAF, ATPase, and Fis domain
MEIIQQRLIWFLGTASILALTFRLRADSAINADFIPKLRIGLGLLMFGSLAGIVTRLGIFENTLARQGVSFYLENIAGALFGWSFVLWGLVDWIGKNYGDNWLPAVNSGVSRRSAGTNAERLAEFFLNSKSSLQFLESISRYLQAALNCGGITFHVRSDTAGLALKYHFGFPPESIDQIARPSQPTLAATLSVGQEIQVHKDFREYHANSLLMTKRGPACQLITVPIHEGSAVLTFYYSHPRDITAGDKSILEFLARALSSILKMERVERNLDDQRQSQDLFSAIAGAFNGGEDLYKSLIRCANEIYGSCLFKEINLYLLEDRPVQTFDFRLKAGALLNIRTGRLTDLEFPFLHIRSAQKSNPENIDGRTTSSAERKSLIISGAYLNRRYCVEMIFDSLDQASAYARTIVSLLSQQISRKLLADESAVRQKASSQLMAAVNRLQEKALAGYKLSDLLQGACKLVVENGIYHFCKITICNPQKTALKTAAVSFARTLKDQPVMPVNVDLARTPMHSIVLNKRAPVGFSQYVPGEKMNADEATLILPGGIVEGFISPITLEGNTVGLITAGNVKSEDHQTDSNLKHSQIEQLASLLSMVFTIHKGKKAPGQPLEGKKKLKLARRESPLKKEDWPIPPRMKTRINGPLAGIMASCEYLRDNCPSVNDEVSRYLKVIEKNAEILHNLTSESSIGTR